MLARHLELLHKSPLHGPGVVLTERVSRKDDKAGALVYLCVDRRKYIVLHFSETLVKAPMDLHRLDVHARKKFRFNSRQAQIETDTDGRRRAHVSPRESQDEGPIVATRGEICG